MKRIFVCLLAVLLSFQVHAIKADGPHADVTGTDISAFSSTTLSGINTDGSVFQTKALTVLHYFATWSSDCIKEIAYMQQALREFDGEIQVYGLLHQDATSTPDVALQLFEEQGVTYQTLILDDVLAKLVQQNNYIPQTFIVSRRGTVTSHFVGTFSSYSVLERLINDGLSSDETHHIVKFVDGLTGEILKTEAVPHNGNATPPTPQEHQGYQFAGWQGNYLNVTQSGTVTAIYIPIDSATIFGDADGDGIVTISDAVYVMRCALALVIPSHPIMNGDLNNNGILEIFDSVYIARIALGIF